MILGYIAIAVTALYIVLSGLGLIDKKWHVWVIYGVGCLLVLQTSMLGGYLVGSDIQSEYWIAKHNYNKWDLGYPHLYNASLSTGLIAPELSKFLHIDLVWIFKLIYPILFALAPVLLYLIYKEQISRTRALFAILFFMVVPVYSLEMPQLPRQELAEVIFALVILAMVSTKWQQSAKMLIIGFGSVLTMLIHFTIGLALFGFLLAILLVNCLKGMSIGILQQSRVRTIIIIIAAGVLLMSGWHWAWNVAEAMPVKAVTNIWQVAETTPDHLTEITYNTSAGKESKNYLARQEQTVQIAIGMDLFKVSWLGIIFRILQYITQALVVIGCVWLLFRWRDYKFSTEFIACIAASSVMLLMCIFIPNFSGLLGMTRFYHLALFFLAPMLILGVDCMVSLTSWVTSKVKHEN